MKERNVVQRGFPQARTWFSIRDYIPGQPIPTLIWSKELGKVVVNPLKQWVKPYTLVTDPADITLAANGVSEPIPMVIDGKGSFEIFDAFYRSQQAEGFTVTLYDADSFGPDQRPILMNREVHVATVASGEGVTLPLSGAFGPETAGGRPYRWSETFWMDVSQAKKGAMIVAVFRNLSSSQNTIRFSLHGRRWYHVHADADAAERMEEIYRERPRTMPYFWTTDEFVTLTAGATPVDFQIRLGDDAWSELHRLSVVAASQAFDILLFETASGRKFMDQAIRAGLVFGSGELPLILGESTLLEPNMKLTTRLTYPTGSSNDVWMTFAGRKVFEDPRDTDLLRPGTSPRRP
jgi:hypothetical protein